jgi:hypothetical protein
MVSISVEGHQAKSDVGSRDDPNDDDQDDLEDEAREDERFDDLDDPHDDMDIDMKGKDNEVQVTPKGTQNVGGNKSVYTGRSKNMNRGLASSGDKLGEGLPRQKEFDISPGKMSLAGQISHGREFQEEMHTEYSSQQLKMKKLNVQQSEYSDEQFQKGDVLAEQVDDIGDQSPYVVAHLYEAGQDEPEKGFQSVDGNKSVQTEK